MSQLTNEEKARGGRGEIRAREKEKKKREKRGSIHVLHSLYTYPRVSN